MSIDAHCHIDLHPDPEAVVKAAIAAKITVVAVTTTPAAFSKSSTFTDINNGIIPALGMHPEVVGLRPHDISIFSRHLSKVTWVGEIGIDGSPQFRGSLDAQVRAFEHILRECTNVGGRLLSVHSRRATRRVFDLIIQYPDAGIPVFHWFSGRPSEVAEGVEHGGYFSVNLQMLQSESGRAVARRIPLDRLLTESDAPFASGNSSSDLAGQLYKTELKLAEVFSCQVAEIIDAIRNNFLRLTSKFGRI